MCIRDRHYEHWLVASSYLAYGGTMQVIRADDQQLVNAVSGVSTSIKIKSSEHYNQLGYDENTITNVTVAAKNPGTWANGIKVALIDAKGDQVLVGASNANLAVGVGVTQAISKTIGTKDGTRTIDGHLKGLVTEISGSDVTVKVVSHVSAAGTETNVDYQQGGYYNFANSGSIGISTAGTTASVATTTYTSQKDWFEQQELSLIHI